MTPYEEAACYHDMRQYGYFSVLIDRKQRTYRLAELETVLNALPSDTDVFLGQAEFNRFDRRIVHLERLGLCFADCETHKSGYADLSPEQQARVLLMHCEDTGLPRPSIINYSGRGLHVKWPFATPLPAQALPRWNAVQWHLGDALTEFAVDRGARDGSRCLRAVGTVNSRSGQQARVVWAEETGGAVVRWDFEALCKEVLPIDRAALQAKKIRTTPNSAKRPAGRCNLWQPKQLWWNRLDDVRRLIVLRGWTEGVPEGYRNNFLFVAACAVAWGMELANLRAEVATLAKEFTPSLPLSQVRAITEETIARVLAGTRYKFSNLRLIELLDVQADEQSQLLTICDPDERIRRKRQHDRLKARKHCDREEYEAQAAARHEQAHSLRSSGLSYRQIAEAMSLTIKQVDNLLNRRTPLTP